jgi:hypothetical protein
MRHSTIRASRLSLIQLPKNWKEFQNGYLVTRQESVSALCYNVCSG